MNHIAVVFPGQGSHFVGMGKDLYEQYEVVRRLFEEANDILGYNITQICFEGNLLKLNSLENMFPALFMVSTAMFQVYMLESGTAPKLGAGHSLGEYAALTCSGALDYADALRVLRRRGFLAQQLADSGLGAMTIVDGVDIQLAEAECKRISSQNQIVSISCYNSPSQIAISGHQDAVMQLEDRLIESGAQISPILTAPPMHCSLMQSVADELETELKQCSFHDFQWPVIANVDALPYINCGAILPKLKLQLTRPVQWSATIHYLEKQGITTIIELGPQSVLTNLLKTYTKNISVGSFGNMK